MNAVQNPDNEEAQNKTVNLKQDIYHYKCD